MRFTQILLQWYKNNKRDLPWRETKNAYKIWLSEIILQQTQIKQGISYYYKFIENYPDIFSLGEAHSDEVMKHWQGLGYYNRAKNLLHTAKYISSQLNGVFPSDYSELIKLNGVGDYTASAIASIAFNKPFVAIDGNALRVFSRIFGVEEPVDTPKGLQKIKLVAENEIGNVNPGKFNQAVMDFGALQCKKSPDCTICPFFNFCAAHLENKVSLIPQKKNKTKVTTRYLNYLIFSNSTHIYITKRENKGIWEGLYDFPLLETKNAINKDELIDTSVFKKKYHHLNPEFHCVSQQIKHQLTHQTLFVTFYHFYVSDFKNSNTNNIIEIIEIDKYPVPKVIEKHINTHCPFI